MSKNVTFYLGASVGLATRTLVVTRMHRAGDDSAPAASHNADAGAVTSVVVELADATIFQAVLSDVKTSGEARPAQVIQFHTAELLHLGPTATGLDGSEFRVQDMEDLSSSSSSSSSSQSSSSSSSSDSSSSSSSSSDSSSSSSSQSSSSSSSSDSSSSASSQSSSSSDSSSSQS